MPATKIARMYQKLTAERFAYSADLLAMIWYRAWVEAGKPDLTFYRSFTFHLQPEPLTPSYLTAAEPAAQ